MKSQRQIVYERAEAYAKTNLKKISVAMGEYKGNKMCQHNARQSLEEGSATHIVAALSFVPKSGVNIHFMPVIENKITDNTLGYLSKYNTYYLIKEYHPKDLINIHMTKLLDSIKDEYLGLLFSPEERAKHNITKEHI
ncbi:hypothetical protein C4564_00470 [Candidatus Microgenomates bacterium]|nr:MAG: hypothetical protein C4564_00470 [Candidatus Microgenomates bacterium]